MLEDEPDAAPDTDVLLLRAPGAARERRARCRCRRRCMVNSEEFGEILQDAIDGLPEELRQARWLLKEREESSSGPRREADRIIEAARVRAERMVERTEVVREARRGRGGDRRARRPPGRARSATRPRTTSTASSPRSRSCSTARCSRCRRAASACR